MNDKYYKVCFRDHERNALTSAAVKGGRAEVKYEVGRPSTPPDWLAAQGYGLLVFTDLTEARVWAHRWGRNDCAVFECAVGGLITPLPRRCSVFAVGFKGQLIPAQTPLWPERTAMVTSLTLEKEV